MQSRHLSILPDNSAGNLTADSHTGDQTADTSGNLTSYRARYQEFLNQQAQRNQRKRKPSEPVNIFSGLMSFVIFVVLFLAILALLGFGLSRLSGNAKGVNGSISATGKPAATMAEASPSPAIKMVLAKDNDHAGNQGAKVR